MAFNRRLVRNRQTLFVRIVFSYCNVGAPHQPDADLHFGAAPVSSLGAASSAYLASYQPGAAIQFGAATATSLVAAPPAT